MTEDEHRQVDEIYRALMVPRSGETESLIEQMRRVTRAWPKVEVMSRDWSRIGWVARGAILLLLTLGAAITAGEKFFVFLSGWLQ